MFMFHLIFLEKSDEAWTFESKIRTKVEPKIVLIGFGLVGLTLIAASLAGLVFGVPLAQYPQDGFTPFIVFGAGGTFFLVFDLLAWRRSNWPVKALFDLRQQRVSLTIKRPWCEVSQTYSFAEIRSFNAVGRTAGGIFLKFHYWEGYLELWSAKRICLGLDLEDPDERSFCLALDLDDPYERMGKYLGEIRAVTGIA